MKEHTPGPWKAHTYPPEEGQQHHVTAGEQDTLRICETGRRDLRSANDARLIAAAPDLLETLRKIAGGHFPVDLTDRPAMLASFMRIAQEEARKAVAKATGEGE